MYILYSKWRLRKRSIGWDLRDLETAAVLALNEEKQHNSDSESNSSSEYSEDNEEDDCGSSEDETEHVEEVSGIQNTSVCEIEDDEIAGTSEALDILKKKPALHIAEENETDSNEGREILPSLLLPGQCFLMKKLVEVLEDDNDENTERAADYEHGENSENNGKVLEDKEKNVLTKETEDQRILTKKAEEEKTLCDNVAKLSVSECHNL